jgi:hypothetical protein
MSVHAKNVNRSRLHRLRGHLERSSGWPFPRTKSSPGFRSDIRSNNITWDSATTLVQMACMIGTTPILFSNMSKKPGRISSIAILHQESQKMGEMGESNIPWPFTYEHTHHRLIPGGWETLKSWTHHSIIPTTSLLLQSHDAVQF